MPAAVAAVAFAAVRLRWTFADYIEPTVAVLVVKVAVVVENAADALD